MLLLATTLGTLHGTVLHAQYGEPDPTFGNDGFTITDAWGQTNAGTLTMLADGSMVVGGFRLTAGGSPGTVRMIKLDAQGAIDPSFGDNGVVTWDYFLNQNVWLRHIVELPDGRLLVAAWGVVGFNDARQLLLRFTPDGQLDESFGDEGMVFDPWDQENATVLAMVVDAQGRILLGGERRIGTGNFTASEAYVMRLLPDGDVDGSFGTEGVALFAGNFAKAEITCMEVLPDGRLVAGMSSFDLEESEARIVRLLPTGAIDNTFADNGTALVEAFGEWRPFPQWMALDGNGRIRMGCLFEDADGAGRVGSFALLADGTLDSTYGTDGLALAELGVGTGDYDFPMAMLVDADDALLFQVAADDTDEQLFGWVRQFADGIMDQVFAPTGMKVAELPPNGWLSGAVTLQGDGKLVAAGGVDLLGGGVPPLLVLRVQPTATFTSVPEQAPFLTALSLFPNPVADRFTLAFHHESDSPLRIELMDLQGRLVYRFAEQRFVQGVQRLELAWPAEAAQGAYVLAITGTAGRVAVPMVR